MRILTVLYAIAPVLYASYVNQTTKPQPNIVFILADDLGWSNVGFNNPDIISPNIDELARTGMILNKSYVQPLCSPSRAALMTGVYPFRLGLSHYVIYYSQDVCVPLNRTFLPEVLKQGGYSTHLVGKWHLGFCKWECTPTYRGFDTFYGFYQPGEDYVTKMVGGGYDFRDGTRTDTSVSGIHSSYLFRNRVEEIINNHDISKPLFLDLSFQEVHTPLQVPQEYYDMYPNIKDSNLRNLSGLVTAMDATIGKLVQALKDKGLYDNTLIVFSADNGGMVSDGGINFPLRGSKATIFEGGTRAAAFVHGPMFKNVGVRYDGMIHLVDWFPTILEAAGINVNVPDQDGISQWKSLLNLSPSLRDEVVYNLDYHPLPIQGQAAIRVGDYKLITGFPGLFRDWYNPDRVEEYSPETRELSDILMGAVIMDQKIVEEAMYGNTTENFKYLFNLKDDPEERNNIYDKKPEIVKRMTERLEYHKTRYVTPNFPPTNPNSDPARWGGVWTPGWC